MVTVSVTLWSDTQLNDAVRRVPISPIAGVHCPLPVHITRKWITRQTTGAASARAAGN